MFHKLKQFNDLRKQANSLRSKLAEETVTIEKSSVTITMDGNQEVKTLTLKEEYLAPSKKKELENGLKDAVNDAIKKAQRVMAAKIKESGEFKIPGLTA